MCYPVLSEHNSLLASKSRGGDMIHAACPARSALWGGGGANG